MKERGALIRTPKFLFELLVVLFMEKGDLDGTAGSTLWYLQ